MTDVFISYSRKDIAFARLLHEALLENELETWIDWQDIPPSTDWLAEVYEAIEGADAFVFVISETSLDSEICGLEIAHAAKHNKRLIPIVIKDVEAEQVPKELAVLNWIFFEDAGEKFAEAMEDLVTAITVDQDWVKAHTRFENRALAWERKENDRGLLLRGSDLAEAEAWLAGAAGKDPQPTALQTQYILKSREDSTRRQRITLGAVGVGLVVAICLGILAWTQRNIAVTEGFQRATAEAVAVAEADTRATAQEEAVAEANARATAQVEAEVQRDEADRQSTIALSRALSMTAIEQQEVQPVLALLLAAEAYVMDDNLQTRSSLLTVLQSNTKVERRFLHGHPTWVGSVDFSPDGQFLASGGQNDDIMLWRAVSGEQVGDTVYNKPVTGNWGGIDCVVFSPDGNYLATTGASAIVLWEVTQGGLNNPREFINPGGGIPADIGESLAFSPDGATLVSGGPENSFLLWDAALGEVRTILSNRHSKEIDSIAYSPDGLIIASASADDNVILWDAENGNLLQILSDVNPEAKEGVGFTGSRSIDFSPDGQILAAGLSDGSVRLWDVNSGKEIGQTFLGHTARVFAVAFSPDGNILASGGYDDTLLLWDVETGELLYEPLTEHSDSILGLAFDPAGTMLASSSMDNDIILWEMGRGSLPKLHSDSILSLAFSSDSTVLASSAKDNSIRFWDIQSRQPYGQPITGLDSSQTNLAFSPDGKLLAVYCDGICLWDIQSSSLLMKWNANSALYPSQLVFNTQKEMLATGDGGGNIRLWNTADGSQIGQTIQAFEGEVFALGFSEDGNTLFAANAFNSRMLTWDLTTGEATYLPLESSSQVGYIMNFSPNAELLSAGTAGGNWNDVLIFDTSSGQALFEPLKGHTDFVLSLAFSPDNKILATGSADHTVRLWDVVSGQTMGMPLTGHNDSVIALAYSPDGSYLASTSSDDPIRLWEMDPEGWFTRACEIANRSLTIEEWETFLPDLPYQETCFEIQ
jgi:WD40 repeat protein